jgi:hypothetical protein
MQLTRVKIIQIYISDKRKDGTPFITKTGKNFWRIGIKVDRFDEWYSTTVFNPDSLEMGLKQGDEVDLIFYEKDGFKNFKFPTRLDKLEMRVEALENQNRTVYDPN